jgi:hypothetical protein
VNFNNINDFVKLYNSAIDLSAKTFIFEGRVISISEAQIVLDYLGLGEFDDNNNYNIKKK